MRVKDRTGLVHDGYTYHLEFLTACGVKLVLAWPESWGPLISQDARGDKTEAPTSCLLCIGEQT